MLSLILDFTHWEFTVDEFWIFKGYLETLPDIHFALKKKDLRSSFLKGSLPTVQKWLNFKIKGTLSEDYNALKGIVVTRKKSGRISSQ